MVCQCLMVRTEQGLFFTCFQFSGKTFSFLAVERKGENSSFIGFPLILLWKERCAFSTQVDYGESIQPAARDSDPEIWSQDYGFFPQRPCTGRCVCENSAGGNWNPTRFQHFALLSIFFFVWTNVFWWLQCTTWAFPYLKNEMNPKSSARCNFLLLALSEGIT